MGFGVGDRYFFAISHGMARAMPKDICIKTCLVRGVGKFASNEHPIAEWDPNVFIRHG
jgi:hypothetical protein